MTDRRGVALGVLTAAPVGVCALVSIGMVLTEDQRILAMDLALPGAVLIAGAVLSAVPAAMLVWRGAGTRSRRHEATALRHAAETAALQERERRMSFLARLDHELKNPITAIRATAVAAPDGATNPAWQTVDAQAAKLSTLVRDLRKLAELESRPLDLEVVDLEQVIAEAITALRQQNAVAGARVELSVTRVPWAAPPLSVDIDLLSLAIDNVLGNAVKYSTSGPIEVRLREESGWVIVEVADAGRGIPAADAPQVFSELARAQNARDVSGSGIGLTLVASVMRLHGGDVSIRSAEGSGTIVTMRLPVKR